MRLRRRLFRGWVVSWYLREKGINYQFQSLHSCSFYHPLKAESHSDHTLLRKAISNRQSSDIKTLLAAPSS